MNRYNLWRIVALSSVLLSASSVYCQESKPTIGDEQAKVTLDPFTVTATSQKGYGVTSLASATRLNTPIREIPQSVNVITSDFINVLGGAQQSDIILWAPGVTPRQNVFDGTVIRGFLTTRTYNDGVRNFNGSYQSDLANFDRIEIIKGPAAAVIGTGEAGGFVNRVSKKPLETARISTKLTVGSDSFYRADLDMTGPISKEKNILYRTVLAYQATDTTFPGQDIERTLFAPAVSWKPFDNTNLLFQYEYQNAHDPNDFGALAKDGAGVGGTFDNPAEAQFIYPKKLFLGDKFTGNNNLIQNMRLTATQKLGDIFQARAVINGFRGNVKTARASISSQVAQPDGGMQAVRSYNATNVYIKTFNSQFDVVAQYALGATNHSTLAGYEYIWNYADAQTFGGSLPNLDLFNPVYGAVPANVVTTGNSLAQTNQSGYFVQQQSKFFRDRLVLTAGIRYDKTSITTKNRINNTFTRTTPIQEKVVNAPRYGATFALTNRLSVYGVFSKQTAPPSQVRQFPTSVTDQTLLTVSTVSELKEVGIKGELLNGGLTTTLAAFDLSQSGFTRNVTKADGSQENVLVAGNRVKGFELEVVGALTSRLQMVAGASYNTEFASSDTGLPITAVPKLKVTTFLDYKLTKAFSVNAGVIHYGEQIGIGIVAPQYYKVSKQTRYDAGAQYEWNRWKFAFSIQNITDELFLTAFLGTNSNTISPFRNWKMSASYVW